jgi:sortase A
MVSAAILAVLLFAAGISASATDKPLVARIAQPNAKTPLAVDMPPAMVGKIEIPALGLATRVLEGDDARTLRLAVGHIPGTAVPGPSGNVGLAGHRTSYFRSLQKIKVGDEIRYSTLAGTFTYRVVSLRVVLPNAIEVLDSTQRPTLTLVTCYPFHSIGAAPKRFIVHAEMVPASPASNSHQPRVAFGESTSRELA